MRVVVIEWREVCMGDATTSFATLRGSIGRWVWTWGPPPKEQLPFASSAANSGLVLVLVLVLSPKEVKRKVLSAVRATSEPRASRAP